MESDREKRSEAHSILTESGKEDRLLGQTTTIGESTHEFLRQAFEVAFLVAFFSTMMFLYSCVPSGSDSSALVILIRYMGWVAVPALVLVIACRFDVHEEMSGPAWRVFGKIIVGAMIWAWVGNSLQIEGPYRAFDSDFSIRNGVLSFEAGKGNVYHVRDHDILRIEQEVLYEEAGLEVTDLARMHDGINYTFWQSAVADGYRPMAIEGSIEHQRWLGESDLSSWIGAVFHYYGTLFAIALMEPLNNRSDFRCSIIRDSELSI